MIAHNPLHGSGRAGVPHPALALGDDAHATQGIGMTDSRPRQPASDETPHAIPKNAAVLAPPPLTVLFQLVFFQLVLFQPLFHEAAPFAIFEGWESMPSGAEVSLTLPLAAR